MTERKMTRCFMNGKTCIYEREIDDVIASHVNIDGATKSRASYDKKKAFFIMPFGEQLDVLYQWELAPFFRNGGSGSGDDYYKCSPERADDVRQVGFIICEKICKKIQEADYIVADLSFDNPNVFYELGLAAALRKKIVPICVEDKCAGRLNDISKLGIHDLFSYPRFGTPKDGIQEKVWLLDNLDYNFEQMSGDNIVILHAASHTISTWPDNNKEESDRNEEVYDFGALCKTAVKAAVNHIFSQENIERRPELKLYDKKRIAKIDPECVDSNSTFSTVIAKCKLASCVLVDVSEHSAISNFFWLGYIHGIGGNAIPINSYGRFKPSDKKSLSPFDIRALWHIAFREDHPSDLLKSLQQILEHIYIRKAKNLNREAFWKNILKDNQVSIFLGSLYLEDLGRNTIGDWDYRTAAEIANYLSISKETMKVTLKSPLPKWESKTGESKPDDKYLERLKEQLQDNSIIIGSADVNDLTEVALCKILDQTPFSQILDTDARFTGYIAYKKYSKRTEKNFPETAFYKRDNDNSDSRGFIIQEGAALRKELMERHVSPGANDLGGVRRLLGQLVVAKNPFAPGKWIVIISGISGPATLGIAQMLTGCMYEEFTINNKQQDQKDKQQDQKELSHEIKTFISKYSETAKAESPLQNIETCKVVCNALSEYLVNDRVAYDTLSEYMLSRLLEIANKEGGEVNALVSVYVYHPTPSETSYSNDERKVIVWDFPNLSDFMKRSWSNPNSLWCTKNQHF